MIRKNILAIALLGVLGFSQAADVENLRTISYLNEPLRLQADLVGDGEIVLAAPTEYLRLNHPIPNYDLSVEIVDQDGGRQLIVRTTEDIESPALTLLLEGKDSNNRRQLFELPILLDFKPESVVAQKTDSEIVIDGVIIDKATVESTVSTVPDASTDKVALENVPKVEEKKVAEEIVLPSVPTKAEKISDKFAGAVEPKTTVKPEVKKSPEKTVVPIDKALVKRYGPVTNGETLWSIANKVRPSGMTPQKMIEIIKANNPSAFTSAGVLKANVTLVIPTPTEKVQHKFVADKSDTDSTGHVGFIYELPKPPVIVVENNTVESPVEDDVTVKIVRPVTNNDTTNQDFVTLAPDITPKTGDEVLDVDPVKVTEQIQVSSGNDVTVSGTQDIAVPADITPTESTTGTIPIATKQPTNTAVESTEAPVNTAEPVKIPDKIETTTTEVAPEKPKPRKVYIMPEPEPEPSIIDLLFENIIYIGAGALILILAILAIVMRRRKSGESTPKKVKEKPSKLKLAKKPKDEAVAEDVVSEAEVTVEVIEEAKVNVEETPKKKGFSLFGKKKEKEVKPKVDKPAKKGFSLFGKKKVEEEPATEIKPKGTLAPKKKLKMDVQPVDKPTTVPKPTAEAVVKTAAVASAVAAVAATPKKPVEDSTEILSLDFNISPNESEIPASKPEAPVQDEVEISGLDFSLPDMDASFSSAPSQENTKDSKDKDEEYGGLDFDLSSFATPAPTSSAESKGDKDDVFDGLDFDLSLFTVSATEEAILESTPESTVSESLSEIEQISVAETRPVTEEVIAEEELPVVEEVSAVEEDADSGFGENNPLFATSQNDKSTDDNNAEENEELDMPEVSEHISFSDLLGNAEETLVSDSSESDKPDFSTLLEEPGADFESLVETSHGDGSDAIAALDLSFVADSTESSDGLKFIDSIDLSDEIQLDDPIDNSVRDNVAKAEEVISVPVEESEIEEPVAEELITVEDVPVVTTTDIELPEVDLIDPTLSGIKEIAAEEIEAFNEQPMIDLGVLDFTTTSDDTTEDAQVDLDVDEVQPTLLDDIDFMNISMPEVDTPDTASALDTIFAELSAAESAPVVEPEVTLVEPELVEVEPEVIAESEVEAVVEPEIITEPEPIVEEIKEVVKVAPVVEPIAITPVATEVQDSLVGDAADFESEKVKLELAIAYMEFDPSLAQPLLEEVAKQGSAAQIEKAKELLAQL